MRQVAYGSPADAVDEYICIGKSTAIESQQRFCRAVIRAFGSQYLRAPTQDDLQRLLDVNAWRGFPGMLGSLDCMQWVWKNCPAAWCGQFTRKKKEPTIVLEAVASYDLWIWQAFFGMPSSNNDINILDQSPLFADLAEGRAPEVQYSINGHEYKMGYYLADGK